MLVRYSLAASAANTVFLLRSLLHPSSSVMVTSVLLSRPWHPRVRVVPKHLPAVARSPRCTSASPAAEAERGRGGGSCHFFLLHLLFLLSHNRQRSRNQAIVGKVPGGRDEEGAHAKRTGHHPLAPRVDARRSSERVGQVLECCPRLPGHNLCLHRHSHPCV